jgi:ATP-binding cassette, subfamily C, bacterial
MIFTLKKIYWAVRGYLGLSKRITTPTILQMEAAECGSASLNIALSYHKKHVPAAELRYQCGVSRDGVNAFNVSEAAKYYGLDGIGYKADVDDLIKEIKPPAILWWIHNHFVVLEGFVGDYAYINDPATGPRKVTLDDFKEKYSGVAISCNPTDKFEKGGAKPKFFEPLAKRMKNLKTIIASLISLQLFMVVIGIALAIFGQIFVDHFFYRRVPPWASTFFWGFAFLVAVNLAARWLRGQILNRAGKMIAISLSTRFLWHVLRLPIPFFQQRFGGEIIRRIGINTRVSNTVAGELGSLVVNTSVVFLYAVIIYQYDPLMALAAVAIVGTQLTLILVLNRIRMNAYARTQQDTAVMTGVSIDTIMNAETLTLYGSDHFGFQRVMNNFIKILNRYQVIGKMDVFLGASSQFLTQLSSIAVLMIGGWRVMFGALTVGMLVTLQVLVQRMVSPLQRLASVALLIPTLKMDLQRLDDVLENPIDPIIDRTERKTQAANVDKPPFEEGIRIENVVFGYVPRDDPLFKDFSLEIKAGQVAGITGANGSGKTTLSKLITAQYLPWSGQVLFDGMNVSAENPDWIHQNIAVVESENLFLQGTLKENLTMWNPAVDEQQLSEACSIACIEEEIENRHGKYLCKINEGASDFSQGQKQRLAIARAVLFKPKILILDEALSNLDRDLQSKIMSKLAKLKMTIIVVAHRIHTLKNCERIIVLESGKVVQDGSLDRLIREEGYIKDQFAEEYELMDKEVF